jgi:hypothetical protein
MAIGRISGPLLKANLLREGVDLAFETDLLYLNVNDSRIGINTATPQYDLDVNGTIRSNGLDVSTLANIADITFTGNTISTTQPTLELGTADTVVYQNKLTVDSISVENNVISTNVTNENLEFRPNGTGTVEIFANTNVYGNIVATGSITADGNITIGNQDTDAVTFNAEIISNIIPDATNTYDLGSDPDTGGKQWRNIYVDNIYADTATISTPNLTVDGVTLSLRQGNIYYVAENGSDSQTGTHQNDPFASLTHALTVATAGDTVHIYPGTYTETFPLTVPAGVTVKGHSLRSVNIKPSLATKNNDAFLLNGEVTIEDITVKDFFTGYAFKFAPGFTVTSRSPYIRNVSVITAGSVTSGSDPRGFAAGDAGKGAYIDGAVASVSSREASCLFHSVTFITPGVDALVITNGARVEWLNCFTYFANRGMYAFDGASGLQGAGKTALRVDNVTGTFSSGQTVTYYDTDGVTVLATGTISSKDADGKFYVSGKQSGFETYLERVGKTATIANEARLDTTLKKFGTASLELDGTGDYISYPSHADFGFGTGDFCLEAWVYPTTTGVYRTIFDLRTTSPGDGGGIILGITDANQLYFYYNFNFRIGPVGTVPINTWTHVRLSRVSGNTRAFVNGTQVGSTYVDSNNYAARPLRIGADPNGSFAFAGHIDEVRISKGAGRSSSNFIVPTSQYLSDQYTVLLLHFNGTDSSVSIVDDAQQAQDIRFSGGATATAITLADFTDFGGEVRSIASACVYGNYGAYGNGPGVLMYLISQNFAYIGNGKETSNDPLTVIQANEVVELNNARIRYSSVDHDGDFRVGDLFYVDQQTGTVNFTSATFNIETSTGISITTGSSTTNITGEYIDTGNLRISGNTISSTTGDIILDAASGTIRLDATGAFNLPTGTTAQRPGTPTVGMIRFNTQTNLFEGYDGNWRALNGVYDLDLNTYITAELTPGANDNTIRFYANGDLVADMTTTRFRSNRIEVDDIAIDDNVISTITTNQNLVLNANGVGSIVIDELSFKDSSITNTTTNGITYFRNSGSGYFKIDGTNGFVVPVGLDTQRPIPPYRELGMMRYNTNQNYLEIYDGSSWVSVAGSSGAITYNAAENLAIEYILTLG